MAFQFTLYPFQKYIDDILLFIGGKDLAGGDIVPLFKASPTAAGTGVLGNKDGVSFQRSLLTVIIGIFRGEPLCDKVTGVTADGIYPLLNDVILVVCTKVKTASEVGMTEAFKELLTLREGIFYCTAAILSGDIAISGFFCLSHLELSWDMVELCVLDEYSPCLLKGEGHPTADALTAKLLYPAKIAGTGIISRFAAAGNVPDQSAGEVFLHIYFAKHRFADDLAVLDRQTQQDLKAIVGTLLILAGGADGHVVPAISPIVRKALFKAVYSFGYDVKIEVASLAYDIPAFLPPGVSLIEKKV